MAKIVDAPAAVKPVLPGTPEMEALLSSGYGIDLAQAKEIMATREKNPALVSYEEYTKARAFLAAYNTRATVIDVKNIGVRPQTGG
jgi:hypothetical protein